MGKPLTENLSLQVRVESNEMLKRCHHGAAALSVSSECVEVILFGGVGETTDLAVLRFGMFCGDVWISQCVVSLIKE